MYRVEDDQAECLADQMLSDMFGLESGVSPVGCCSFFLYCDHVHSITKNTVPSYSFYYSAPPIGYYLDSKYSTSSRNLRS